MTAKEKLSELFQVIISAFASGWLVAVGILINFTAGAGVELSFSSFVNLPFFIAMVVGFSIIFLLLYSYFDSEIVKGFSFLCALCFFCFSLAAKVGKTEVYIVLFIVIMISLYCFDNKYKPTHLNKDVSDKIQWSLIVAFALLAFGCVLAISVLRYTTYSSPNYDFGIFCNMFYNMKKSGMAVTTCERDKLLSHFAVHISPVFYLILPVYWIFPSPITLAVVQPIVVFSAVIPFFLLAKHLKLSKNAVMFITIAFSVYAPLSTGCFYDLHENCFLVPFLMWMFYFFEKDNKLFMFVSAALVLSVKEDAFVYIVFFAIYTLVARKKYLTGSVLLVSAVAYFGICCLILTTFGTGIMESRYSNLADGGSLIDAAKTIIVNPGYAIGEVLVTKDNDIRKFLYIAEIFCPLVFLPFMSKDFKRYILILPIFINLLTKYPYQYDITFQYTFGISVFLSYFSLLNLADIEKEKQTKLSFASVIASMMLFIMIVLPKTAAYYDKQQFNSETYDEITQALEIIPENASVTATTYYLPHLASRDVIYEDEYHDTPSTQYFVLDTSRAVAAGRNEKYLAAGYQLIYSKEGIIEIYYNPDMP
ncbi:MAG: DUF2079 domain-containing protein [Clostridia bacterium]|nr:DUF2079 domain-containing protein [Clostridia bacterium]